MDQRTIDLTAPFGYGRKHAKTEMGKVPLQYLRDLIRKGTGEAKQLANDILAARESAPGTPPEKQSGPKITPGIYTLVYSTRLILTRDKKRVILQRGDTVQSSDVRNLGVLARKFVKGDLSPDKIAALLETSKGTVPGGKKPSSPVEAIDFKNAMPVKDATAGHPASSVNPPNYVEMSVEELQSWCIETTWMGLDVDEMDRKPEIVAAIKSEVDRVNHIEPEPANGPSGPLQDV